MDVYHCPLCTERVLRLLGAWDRVGVSLEGANFLELRTRELRRTPFPRTSENLPSTHSGELTLGTWLLQRPTHREIMAPLSMAGNHPLFSYISRTRSLPCPELTACLEHHQKTISLSP